MSGRESNYSAWLAKADHDLLNIDKVYLLPASLGILFASTPSRPPRSY
jgi:hypothetical protein